jgi:hypothetical protein
MRFNSPEMVTGKATEELPCSAVPSEGVTNQVGTLCGFFSCAEKMGLADLSATCRGILG